MANSCHPDGTADVTLTLGSDHQSDTVKAGEDGSWKQCGATSGNSSSSGSAPTKTG